MNPKRIPPLRHLAGLVLAVLIGAVCVVRPLARPSIRMDGVGYYAPLASLLFDHDLNLANEIAHVGNFMQNAWLTLPDGRLVDPYPVFAHADHRMWTP